MRRVLVLILVIISSNILFGENNKNKLFNFEIQGGKAISLNTKTEKIYSSEKSYENKNDLGTLELSADFLIKIESGFKLGVGAELAIQNGKINQQNEVYAKFRYALGDYGDAYVPYISCKYGYGNRVYEKEISNATTIYGAGIGYEINEKITIEYFAEVEKDKAIYNDTFLFNGNKYDITTQNITVKQVLKVGYIF